MKSIRQQTRQIIIYSMDFTMIHLPGKYQCQLSVERAMRMDCRKDECPCSMLFRERDSFRRK
jgi:hypothetical protein